MWRQHLPSLLLLFIALCAGGVFAFSLGQAKPFAAIAWYDVLGETVTLLVACGWLGLVVAYRPTGWVSRCLIAGTGLLIWSYALDLFDEFLKYSGVDLHWRIEPMFGAPVSRVCIPRALLFQPFADARRASRPCRGGCAPAAKTTAGASACSSSYAGACAAHCRGPSGSNRPPPCCR